MKRLFITLALMLVVGLSTAQGGIAVGFTEDGYTYAGAGYWTNAAGDYFTRTRQDWGEWIYVNGCRAYQPYYRYSYTAAVKPVSSIDPLAADANAQLVDLLKQREKIQGQIALEKQRFDAFRANLAKLGVTPAFPALPGYGPRLGAYGNSLQLGNFGANGNTVYGYSYSQVADLYGQTDLNALFQQSAALAKGAQGLAGDANSQFGNLIQQANAGAARVAEIRAEGEIAVQKLRAVTPQPRATVTTTVNGQGVSPVTPAPAPPVGVDVGTRVLQSETAKASCVSCHGGAKPAGGLDMGKSLTPEQYLKILNRVSLPASDPRHMPQKADGGPGRQLTANEIHDLLP